MKAVVFGATGHLGAHIVRALLSAGHEVRAGYRSERYVGALDGLAVDRARVDLDTMDGVRQAMEGCDWIFHAAASYPTFSDRRAQAMEHAQRTIRAFIALAKQARPRRVVLTSSASTLVPFPSDSSGWRPLYAAVKTAIEQEMHHAVAEGLPAVIVNPTVCIGEYDSHPFSGLLVLAYAKRWLPVYIDATVNAIYTGDVGVAHVRAAERGRLGIPYLLTCRSVTLREFAGWVAEAAHLPPPRWRVPYPAVLAAGAAAELWFRLLGREPAFSRASVQAAARRTVLDGSSVVAELGLPQTPIDEAVRRAVAWFNTHGYC